MYHFKICLAIGVFCVHFLQERNDIFMRNPNGYGTVAKLAGNRRRPFEVKKTIGWNEKGHPIYQIIGYTETREEGMILLAEYNKSPWDIDTSKITLEELFELWKEKKAIKLGDSSRSTLFSAFKHCTKYRAMKYKEIKSYHMQDCIDNCGKSSSTQALIKNLFNHLDHFAFELDVINKRYSELLVCEPIPETSKMPFTDEEVEKVWAIQDLEWVDSIIFLLYTGFRISEMLELKIANIDLEQRTMKGGTKTKAGKDRIVPIHSKIFELVQRRLNQSSTYLFEMDGKKLTASKYYTQWDKVMIEINCQHNPHECRHTFRSRLDSAGANKRCIDLMMGHKSGDIGERVYTHKTIEELKEAIELIAH